MQYISTSSLAFVIGWLVGVSVGDLVGIFVGCLDGVWIHTDIMSVTYFFTKFIFFHIFQSYACWLLAGRFR